MTPATHFMEWSARLSWIVLVVVLAIVAILFHSVALLPGNSAAISSTPHPVREWPAITPMDLSADWTLFKSRDASGPQESGSLAKWLRLAGTFIPLGDGRRKAIIDNLTAGTQIIVGETDRIGDTVRVLRVYRDRVELRGPSGDEQLWLSFTDRSTSGGTEPETGATTGGGGKAGTVAKGQLGMRQVGEKSWVFSREALTGYYKELMDHPRRLLSVFDSLKPVRDGKGSITGYYVGIEGENEFFEAIQWREGDIVRSVNSVPMSSRREAEYFIREFAEDRVNAFVIEVERDGQLQKMIYQVR